MHDDDDEDEDDALVIEPGTYTFPLVNGGSVSVTIDQQLIVDFAIEPGDGWSFFIERHEENRLEVQITDGQQTIEVEIEIDDDGLEVEIDD